jgi:hypothetical protein
MRGFRTVSGRMVRSGSGIAAVVALGLFAWSGPASSQNVTPPSGSTPVTPQSVNGVQHFLDCFGVLITDSAAHAANCDPGHDVFVSGSTGSTSVDRCKSDDSDGSSCDD